MKKIIIIKYVWLCLAFLMGNTISYGVINDYDGDGKSEVGIYNENTGLVYIFSLSRGLLCNAGQFGGYGFMPVPGDYNGDGYCDLAMYNYFSGNWYILINQSGQMLYGQFGGPGYVPAIGDYDGDGTADIGLYNVFTGKWFVYSLTHGILYLDFPLGIVYTGISVESEPAIPVVADYDGDRKADLALLILLPSDQIDGWLVYYSRTQTSQFVSDPDYHYFSAYYMVEPAWIDEDGDGVFSLDTFDISTGLSIPGDYDGDGIYEYAIYDREGVWQIHLSGSGMDISGPFGGIGYDPISPVCLKYYQCIWGNPPADVTGDWQWNSIYGATVYIYNNCKVHVRDSLFRKDWWGRVEGNKIWFLYQNQTSANSIDIGVINSGSHMSGHRYINGQQTENWTITR